MSEILVERHGRVVLVRLNRPQALNALNSHTLDALMRVVQPLDADRSVGCVVLTGSDRAFAAGADIKEMQPQTFQEMHNADYFSGWEAFARLRVPRIAAVAGYALGGGCELAMMCDIVYAADNAKFGQPEIRIGVMPGMGGSQRLTRLIGRVKAMDLILTGRMMDATEAERAGLVARVFPVVELLPEALAAATTIASYGRTAIMAAREAVHVAEETSLAEGVRLERRAFHALFATHDQKEGMQAFIEKRPACFDHASALGSERL
ncbi:enoyl-CoA hydratase [Variovorax fucosicus]|uniref:enoyl-CoA hydratase n=1 Tax=Variovorax fucosicus TaxID=3053517 RepID=UPI00257660AA|nr:enoyl-CoA hydratase [Variovorax sp. J22G47]MDM0059113.1 enoyl-CoA hydratase [Variovorax sp. J22G47]